MINRPNIRKFVNASSHRVTYPGMYVYTGSTDLTVAMPGFVVNPEAGDDNIFYYLNRGTGIITLSVASGQSFYDQGTVSTTITLYGGDGVILGLDNTYWIVYSKIIKKSFVTATVASGAAVSLTNATGANVTSISLTAGDWDLSAQVDFILTGATSTSHQSGISLTSATLPTQAGGSGLGTDALAVLPMPTTGLNGTLTQSIVPVRLSIVVTTTVYLVAQSAFSVGTEAAYGTIRARRV